MKTYTQMKSIQDFNKKALLGALLAAGMVMGSANVSAVQIPKIYPYRQMLVLPVFLGRLQRYRSELSVLPT